MPGKFEVYKDKAGEYRFRLKAANGQNILRSEGYSGKASCLNGVESVKKNSQNPDRFVKKTTPSGKYRFNLTSSNRQVCRHKPELFISIRLQQRHEERCRLCIRC